MSGVAQRVEMVRNLMREHRVDAWIVNGSDPHVSEYVAPRWNTRSWLSGFTGSAGTIVVTLDKALLWVDSRYYIQGAQQIVGTPFELMKLDAPSVPDHVQWLANTIPPKGVVGIDGLTMTVSATKALASTLSKKDITLEYTGDWFDSIWKDRPAVPFENVMQMDAAIAGFSAEAKLQKIRQSCGEMGCTHTIVSSLDDIAWILNLRGSDIPYSPVFLGYLLIGPKDAVLFTKADRFSDQLETELSRYVAVREYQEVYTYLGTAFSDTDVVYYSPDKTTVRIRESLPASIALVEGRDLSTTLKARKSPVEIEGMRRAHVLDGIAMVKLLAKVSRSSETYNELTIAEQLVAYRKEHEEYLGPSFSPIAGFGAHGALAHYSATVDSSTVLEGNNLLVLDTGGQYRTGTTDITRTLLFGEATEQMRKDYTLVLKGNLSLAAQRFPAGTNGYQLDVLARQFLWQTGYNYGHGTGHGLGFCLNVHEGPQNISTKPIAVPLEVGMVISDEPGVYREGLHGVRIENLVVVQHAGTTEFGEFLAFDVLTLCPFERRLIDTDLLSEAERQMVDAYHGWVYSELSDKLPQDDAAWLREATLPL
ncbi:MAG: aminopeptidase P family protein [Spirochaetae bacterium HGW-Spirochaetae-2]|nr:MAG: aminopeptidase P family protein [Spirochaetae bacterium HGW-Spirochaetae-2]